MLVFDGFVYSQNKISAAGVVALECVERRNAKSCMAKLKTLNQVEIGRFHQHTHPADHEKIVHRIQRKKREMS